MSRQMEKVINKYLSTGHMVRSLDYLCSIWPWLELACRARETPRSSVQDY